MNIAIRGGHTERCTGAKGIIDELTEDRKVKDAVISKLRALGHQVIDCTPPVNYTSDMAIDLAYGVNKANAAGVDLFVSIHFNNAYTHYNGAIGTEVCVYSEFDKAQNVVDNLAKLGFNNRGQKIRTGLYELKHPKMKAMIIETCFVEATEDVEIYKKVGVDAIANAIVKGLTGKTVSSTTPINETTKTESTTKISTHLRDFQRAYNQTYDKNISVDGIYGPETENAIRNTLVKYGQRNSLVGYVQCRVGASVDNVFGNQTKQAVIEFQRKNNLTQDGIVGPNTIKAILNKYNW